MVLITHVNRLPHAVFYAAIGGLQFCLLMPLINFWCDALAAGFGGGYVAGIRFFDLSTMTWAILANLGMGIVLFGIDGLPHRMRSLTLRVSRRLFGWFLRDAVLIGGFVGGVVHPLEKRYQGAILWRHPRFGAYTKADPRVWGRELCLSACFYPIMALILGFPILAMAIPAFGLACVSTLAAARMTKIWSAHGQLNNIKWGRIGVFTVVNGFSSLAASGLVSAAWGYGIQLSMAVFVVVLTFALVHPPDPKVVTHA